MFARCTPSARQTVVRAGRLAVEAGREALGTDCLLLALTEVGPPPDLLGRLRVTPAAVRAEIRSVPGAAPPWGDRELLATLGIDLDEVRRRAAAATSTPLDDPSLWQLRRSLVRPLRVTLMGPGGCLPLDGRSRKVMEVAMYHARRRCGRVGGDELLMGLLADGSNESVRILCRLGVDLCRLWSDLRRQDAAA